MISDDIVRASSSRAPEAGPAASALALIAHMPGLSIRMLSIGVGLSHAATVRLVDRLAAEGLVERREHFTDGRTRSLYLTAAGKIASDEVLSSRDEVIAEGLSILSPDELKVLGAIAERAWSIAWRILSIPTVSAACVAMRVARTARSMPSCMSVA
ncbi:MarR family winged helix-turn-helix transcriptional regulator [Brucella anthropi]|uniref:MarR family winged helix-turn-helix transcriptional regulator n=1 Tax=Brucella anthropi TaxID=529 RepID=UPI001F25D949|nr:MarR family winged helix-turn-helix transcriptional regulator [Brucella anthropi]